jgi:FkbM family methyltransferase
VAASLDTPAPTATPGRHRLKSVLRPVAGDRVYALLHSAAKAWDIRSGRWSEPELALVPRLVRSGDTAVDVGANFGLWTYHLARAAGASGRVVAFEPVPFAAASLRRVLRLTRCANVAVDPRGLGDAPGRMTFVLPLQQSGAINAGLAHVAGRRDERAGASDHVADAGRVEVECEVVRLDDVDLPGDVSFLKCDIEGAELAALRGAVGVLERHAPTLLLEVNPWFLEGYGLGVRDVLRFLAERDYAPHRLDGGRLVPVPVAEASGNLVFPSPRRVERVAALLG